MVFYVTFQMLRELRDALAQQCDLNFRGTGVFLVPTMRSKDARLFVSRKGHGLIPSLGHDPASPGAGWAGRNGLFPFQLFCGEYMGAERTPQPMEMVARLHH